MVLIKRLRRYRVPHDRPSDILCWQGGTVAIASGRGGVGKIAETVQRRYGYKHVFLGDGVSRSGTASLKPIVMNGGRG